MSRPIKKYNPGFLTEEELIASFCVRVPEYEFDPGIPAYLARKFRHPYPRDWATGQWQDPSATTDCG